jgi:hypothetical protein
MTELIGSPPRSEACIIFSSNGTIGERQRDSADD